MDLDGKWRKLGTHHLMWDVLRYYLSIRGPKRQREWIAYLTSANAISTDDVKFPVPHAVVELFLEYLKDREEQFAVAESKLRTEEEALAFCAGRGVTVSKTATKSKDHHQAIALV